MKYQITPPELLQTPEHSLEKLIPTPPPSPPPGAVFEHWGKLLPMWRSGEWEDILCSRDQEECIIGSSQLAGAHFWANEHDTPFCTLKWDGTDNPNSVKITSNFWQPRESPDFFDYGVRTEGELLTLGETRDLKHGDTVYFYGLKNEEGEPTIKYKFKWLQCTAKGWLPLVCDRAGMW
ncbi:hypothetical protein PsYK624_056270 [Phanerochaete sordida]|uniref:Uncharacterized protein n=1 Tax=Phanerochaete sordida TaxID=48140 RepID=A0A9P3G7Z2_9APHY|nr:hypothetical protein PsYK624_056270 [Phanerochaete sordida]